MPIESIPKKICSVEGCGNQSYARGWCGMHYARWRKRGTTSLPIQERSSCSVNGCSKDALARGWCNMHYTRWANNGDPELCLKAVCNLPLSQRLELHSEKITETGCWVWMKALSRRGYGQVSNPSGGMDLAHRRSYEVYVGPIPDGHGVLHRCDNPPCINPGHLFTGTQQDNVNDMVRKGRHRSQRIKKC